MLVIVSECEKILGVFVDIDKSFKIHIFASIKKARQTCNILLTAFNGVDNLILIFLYKIYIRSTIDYASIVYSPYFMYLIDIIENVQRNFIKRLAGSANVDRLKVCNLEPFDLRRIKVDMLFEYELLHGCVKCNLLNYLNVSTGIHNNRGNIFKLNKSNAKLIMRQNNFVTRCINNWNSLSNNIVCVSTCAVFKRQLMAYINFNLRRHAFNASSGLYVHYLLWQNKFDLI